MKHFKNIHTSSQPPTIRSGTSQKAFPTGKSEETKTERNQARDKTEPCFLCATLGCPAGQVPKLQAEVQVGWCLPQHSMAFTQGTQKLQEGNMSRNKPLQLYLQCAGSSHMPLALLSHKQKSRRIIRRIEIKGLQSRYKVSNCPQSVRNRETQVISSTADSIVSSG